jgi:hypothetical protein
MALSRHGRGSHMLVRCRERAMAQVRAHVGKGKVIHGLLRKDEGEPVVRLFRDHDNIPLVHADASKQFLDALAGTTDPEKSARRSARCSSTCSRPRPRRSAARSSWRGVPT